MDFYVSKVALSICALLVVAVLGEATDPGRFVDASCEIDAALGDLCEIAGRGARGPSEGMVTWTVPALSDGDGLKLVLCHGLVTCEHRGRMFVREPRCYIHTWAWDGSGLNDTTLAGLDDGSPPLVVCTGDDLFLTTVEVMLENESGLMVFASATPR